MEMQITLRERGRFHQKSSLPAGSLMMAVSCLTPSASTLAKELLKSSTNLDLPRGATVVSTGVDTFHSFFAFAKLVHDAPAATRALPITVLEMFECTEGVPHRYIVVSVLLAPGRSTYLGFHLRADGMRLRDGPCVFTVEVSDNHAALTKGGFRLVAKLALSPGQSVTGGPTLDAIATLLGLVEQRGGTYDILGRNCIWMSEVVFFSAARKFAEHWLAAGELVPEESLRRYLRGEIDVVTAAVDCAITEGALRFLHAVGAKVLRFFQAVATRDATGRESYLMQDDEIAQVVGAWHV